MHLFHKFRRAAVILLWTILGFGVVEGALLIYYLNSWVTLPAF